MPICIGFGISGPDQVRQLAPVADGLIVGSAIVRRLAEAINRRVTKSSARSVSSSVALAQVLAETRDAIRFRLTTTCLEYRGARTRYRSTRFDPPVSVPSIALPLEGSSDGLLDPERMQELLAAIRELMEREVYPLEPALLSQPFSELVPDLQAVRQKVKALGLWAPHIPRSHGGLGLNCVEYALVGEELGRSPLGHYVFNGQAPDAGNMEILREFGTDRQQERWLMPLVRGDIRSCFAMTEPDHPGSNPVWMGTTAVRDGDDYVIDGRKWFASAADGASFAIVMAVTDPDADPHRRASLIVVPADTPGFRRVRNISCMGHAGDDWASHAELVFEQCRVPRENLLGEEGAGFAMAQARLGPGRIQHAMRWIGVCRRALEHDVRPGRHAAACARRPAGQPPDRAELDRRIAGRRSTPRGSWSCTRPGRSTPRASPRPARRSR